MDIDRFQGVIRFKLTTYLCWILTGYAILSISPGALIVAQAQKPADAIQNLREGLLIVRFPSMHSKIDTLQALIDRTTDEDTRKKWQKMRESTILERDALINDYAAAFKSSWIFSNVIYFMDYEAKKPGQITYFDTDHQKTQIETDFPPEKKFYLHFERSEESKIESLVIYDVNRNKIPRPFPNSFSRGGLGFLFIKLMEKKIAEAKVSKMQKQLAKYYYAVKG